MKRKFYLPLIAMAIGMGSCTNDLVEEVNPFMGKQDVISVNVADESTRTAMDGNNVVWKTGDAIGIFASSMNISYSLSSGEGTTSAEFTGLAPQSSLKEVAYFPFVESATWSENTIKTTLPATYSYSAESNNNAVMAALMAEDAQSSISFQNAGALYAITVENIPEGYTDAVMTYLGADDNVGIAGAATITFAEGVPTLSVPEAADAEKTITITFSEGGNKTFYFPMPVIDMETFPGLQFSLQGEGKTPIKVPAYTKKPQRNKLYAETWTLDAVSGGIVSEANDIDAANAALANDAVTSVAVKDATDTEAITIPAKSAESAAVAHTIDLSGATLPDGAVNIVVEEAEGEGATVDKLTVIVPEGTSAGSYTINAPGTTVTIQGADGTIIETIEATTAENTLIIGAGVKVNSLTINKGNVVLEDGASVELFKVKDAAGLNTAVALGGEVELSADVTLAEAIEIRENQTVVINLNGKTLNLNAQIKNTGNLTLKGGGKISATIDEAIYSTGSLTMTDCEVDGVETLVMVKGGNAVITGGSYANENSTSNGSAYCICISGEGTTATIDTDVNVEATGNYKGGVTVQYNATATISGGSYYGNNNLAQNGLHAAVGATVTYESDVTFDRFYVQAISMAGNTLEPSIVNTANFGTENFTGNKEQMDAKIAGILGIEVDAEEELHAAVAAGNNVKLVGTVTLTSNLEITGQTIIYLNNQTLNLNAQITNTGNLTLKGEGKISATIDEAIYSTGSLTMTDCEVDGVETLVMVKGGNAVITGGSYANENSTANGSAYCICISGEGTTATIDTDVNVEATSNYKGGVTVQYNATATISGGSYYGNNNLAQNGLHAAVGATVTYESDVTFDRFYVQAISMAGNTLEPSIVNTANFGTENFIGNKEQMDAKIAEILNPTE